MARRDSHRSSDSHGSLQGRRRCVVVALFGAAIAVGTASGAAHATTPPEPAPTAPATTAVPEPTAAATTAVTETLRLRRRRLPCCRRQRRTTEPAKRPTRRRRLRWRRLRTRSCMRRVRCAILLTGQTTVTWRVTNNGEAPIPVTNHRARFARTESGAAFDSAIATGDIDGPETDQQVTSTVTIDARWWGRAEESDDITAAACRGPETPADVTFTFTSRRAWREAVVGDTVDVHVLRTNTARSRWRSCDSSTTASASLSRAWDGRRSGRVTVQHRCRIPRQLRRAARRRGLRHRERRRRDGANVKTTPREFQQTAHSVVASRSAPRRTGAVLSPEGNGSYHCRDIGTGHTPAHVGARTAASRPTAGAPAQTPPNSVGRQLALS